MRMIDLFSGGGGFSLAAEWCWKEALEILAFVENEPFRQKVLKKHWPDVPIFGDIRKVNFERFQKVDVLTGGFPCEPFSEAGEQRGKADDRYLWPEMLRAIKGCHPGWVVAENVLGLASHRGGVEFLKVFSDLESIGYESIRFVIPACGVDAPHTRFRIFIIAHSPEPGLEGNYSKGRVWGDGLFTKLLQKTWSSPWVQSARRFHRMADGLSKRMDKDRIALLGDAIVPEIAFRFFLVIKAMEDSRARTRM